MIKVERLSKRLGDDDVLREISFEIAQGEIVAVMGPSGTGKTVLLKHLIGLMRPDAGRVEIDGRDISDMEESDLLQIRRGMGYLFQEGALYDFLSVFENVAFPLREHRAWEEDKVAGRVREVLGMVDLEDVDDKLPSELSGGMKKRVGLARAIVLGPKILLCDEPTSGLDPIRSRDISLLIRNVAKKINATTVITSHDISNAFRIADKVIVLHEGRAAAIGSVDDVQRSPNDFVREFLHA